MEELVLVDPENRTIEWLVLDGGGYIAAAHSRLIDLAGADLTARIDWPPAERR